MGGGGGGSIADIKPNQFTTNAKIIWAHEPVKWYNRFFHALIPLGTTQLTGFMSESLNHSLNRFIKNTDSYGCKTSACVPMCILSILNSMWY